MSPHLRKSLVVVGHGMVGHRFVAGRDRARPHRDLRRRRASARSRGRPTTGSRSRRSSRSAPTSCRCCPRASTTTRGSGCASAPRSTASTATRRTVPLGDGEVLAYDALVLATGSTPFVPPVPGHDLPGCFVYRTIDDLEAIRDAARDGARSAPWSAAGCSAWRPPTRCAGSASSTHVVEIAPRLMPVQVDEAGGAMLRRHIEELGVTVHTGARHRARSLGDGAGRPGWRCEDAEPLDAEVVVFSAGIRPRDELARAPASTVGERGGVVVDEQCRTSDPHVWAIGECAAPGGRVYGLVAPGYAMAEVVVDALLGGAGRRSPAPTCPPSSSCSASTWRRSATRSPPPRARSSWSSPTRSPGVYKKLVVSDDGTTLLGGILVGDATAYGVLRPLVASGLALPANPEELILPAGRGGVETRPARRRAGLLLQRRDQGDDRRPRSPSRAAPTSPASRRAPGPAPPAAPACRWSSSSSRSTSRRQGRSSTAPVRALRAHPAGAVRRGRGARLHARFDRASSTAHGTRPRLRHLQAGGRLDPGQPAQRRPRARRRAGVAAGHQRPLPGQHAAQRHLLGRARGSPAARSPRRS